MANLFTQRRRQHFMMLLKYWRLVFNDHFVIALFFLFGALAYGYAQMLPTISHNNLGIKILLAVFLVIVTQCGRLATLVKSADPVFLLPQTSRMQNYFRRAYLYSWVLGSCILLAGVLITLPLALVTVYLSQANIWLIIVLALIVKAAWLNDCRLLLACQPQSRCLIRWLQWLLPTLVWMSLWLVKPWLGLAVGLVWWVASIWLIRDHQNVNWRLAVKVEQDRMATVFRFFNLFCDVPNMRGRVKRRAYLGFILRWLGENSVWQYLYGRGFVRNTEISDLVARLTVLMAVILFFIPVMWLNAMIAALSLYLIAAQLMPLYDQYANNAFTYIYPISSDEKLHDFSRIVQKVMVVVAVVLVVASIGRTGAFVQGLINLVIALVEVPLLTTRYLKYRIKKL